MAHHVLKRHRGVLVADTAVRQSDAPDRTGIYDALGAGVLSGFEHVARAIHVRAIEFSGILRPKAVIRGHVEDQAATGHRSFERGGVAQIARGRLQFEFANVAARRSPKTRRSPVAVSNWSSPTWLPGRTSARTG